MKFGYARLLEWMRNPEGEGAGGGGAPGAGAASSVVTGAGGDAGAGGAGGNPGGAAAATATAAAPGTGGTGTGTTGTGDQQQQQQQRHPFGDNWRDDFFEALPETDRTPKAKDWLGRRGSAVDVIRSGMHADATISKLTAERVKVPTGQNDDPKDVEQFRKAMGVPEKPDAYQVQPPKEYNNGQWTDFDKDLIPEIQKMAHETNMNQRQLDAMSQMYWSLTSRIKAQEIANATRASAQSRDRIVGEMGREFAQRTELMNRTIGEGMGKYGADAADRTAFLSKRFADGTALGEYYPFVMWLDEMSRERADDGAFYMGQPSDGVDLDKKIDDMVKLSQTDPKEYARIAAPGGELQRMIAAQNRRNQQAAR